MADGSTRMFKKDLPEPQWRALISYAGNDSAPVD
jgi:hypothetical protein